MKHLISYNESVRDKMTPKSPEEIEIAVRKSFDRYHMGWYERYMEIKPLIDEAYEYMLTTDYVVTHEPRVQSFETGLYGFKFNNGFGKYGGPSYKEYVMVYYFMTSKYHLYVYAYNKENTLDIVSIKDIEPWYNRKEEKMSIIDGLKRTLNELTKNDEHKIVLESVRDKMTPKSKEDLLKYVSGLNKEELDLLYVKSVCQQQIPLIKATLQAGADPDAKDPWGLTALYRAVSGSITTTPSRDVIKLLLDAGADPTLPSKRGLTPLNHAKTWHKDLCGLLQQYVKVEESVRDEMTGKLDKIDKWKSTIGYLIEQLQDEFKVSVTYMTDDLIKHYTLFIYDWVEKNRLAKWFDTNTDFILKDLRQLNGNKTMITVEYPKRKMFEGVRDKMTPKSGEDVKKSIEKLPDEDKYEYILKYDLLDLYSEEEIKDAIRHVIKVKPKYIFKDLKYDYRILSEIVSDSEIREAIYYFSLLLAPYMRGYDRHPESLNTLSEIVYYLYKNGYFYDEYDSTGSLWFKSKKRGPYEGGHYSVNAYTKLKDATDYVERMKKTYHKLDEGVRDKMTPKSKEEISKLLGKIPTLDVFKQGIYDGNYDKVEYAVEDGVDVHYDYEWALRHTVEYSQDWDIMKLLLNHGADMGQAIYYAKEIFNSDKVVRLLNEYKKMNKTW